MSELHILISNDDGITAPGIAALLKAAKAYGRVTVVAPLEERSGASHSITVRDPIAVIPWALPGAHRAYAVAGTPADCGKLAIYKILEHDRPDIILSGINRGQNTGTCVLYSGTIGAAFEGALAGIPAIASSLGVLWPDHAEVRPGTDSSSPLTSRHAPREVYAKLANEPEHYEYAAEFTTRLIPHLLGRNVPWGTVINVNVPSGADAKTPVQVGHMSHSFFTDEFREEERRESDGAIIYRNIGDTLVHARGKGSWDDMALRSGHVSVVPISYNMTCESLMTLCGELVTETRPV